MKWPGVSVSFLALLLASVVACAPRRESGSFGLNVVLISIDTLRADHLGCYGYPRNTSPNIDRLAASSTVFLKAYSAAPVTAESHMSMLTSLYPSVHQVQSIMEEKKIHVLDRGITTLPEILKGQGYTTVGFHDGGFVDGKFGFHRGFDVYSWSGLQKAEAWLRDRTSENKFFLFYHTYAVHDPYTPGAPYDTMFDPHYRGKITHAKYDASAAGWSEYCKQFWSRVDKSDPADVAHLVALYDGAIAELDNELGRLFSVIDQYAPRTIVILVSDHGEQFGEHGGFQHGELYEEVLHVPFIIRHPDKHRARIIKKVSLIDLAPTILHMLSIPPIRQFQGKALAVSPVASNEEEFIFAEAPLGRLVCVIRGDRQLILTPKGQEFYELGTDRQEHSEAGDSEVLNPERVTDMPALRDALEKFTKTNERLAKALNRSPTWDFLTQRTLRRLKSLGYIH